MLEDLSENKMCFSRCSRGVWSLAEGSCGKSAGFVRCCFEWLQVHRHLLQWASSGNSTGERILYAVKKKRETHSLFLKKSTKWSKLSFRYYSLKGFILDIWNADVSDTLLFTPQQQHWHHLSESLHKWYMVTPLTHCLLMRPIIITIYIPLICHCRLLWAMFFSNLELLLKNTGWSFTRFV